jgi:hypothetical protein
MHKHGDEMLDSNFQRSMSQVTISLALKSALYQVGIAAEMQNFQFNHDPQRNSLARFAKK